MAFKDYFVLVYGEPASPATETLHFSSEEQMWNALQERKGQKIVLFEAKELLDWS